MKTIDNLVEILKRLRAPDGCPWDRKQTHKSVRGHLVEECSELLDAIDNDDIENMKEEMGDILMHLLLHSQIAYEENHFCFEDVAKEIEAKLIRRHPHVFGEEVAKDENDVTVIWDAVKAKEKPDRKESPFDKIRPDISALRLARDVARNFPQLEEAPQELNDSQKFGKEIYKAVLNAANNKIEPEGALRDYIKLLRENAK
ncbi:MAG: MazG family protein [Opitutales bacterium]